MKNLRGRHHYKNYKELCAALDIVPAPRGSKREAQKQKIQAMYQMTVQPNNSIDLQRIPVKQAERQKKLDHGQIRIIDGMEVDLGSNLVYKHTCIDQLILFRALTTQDRTNTKEGFVISCFDRTKLFRELLARGALLSETQKYSVESMNLVHELVVSRLYSMVNTRLSRYEEKEYIRLQRFYLLKSGEEASIEEVQPYVDKALHEMKLKTEFQAYANKATREKFLELRSSYYEEDYKEKILCKRFVIEPLLDLDVGDFYTGYDDAIVGLTNRDIQIILTSFFDIFREKAIFDFENSTKLKLGKGRPSKKQMMLSSLSKEQVEEVKEIINTYCAYVNTPLKKEDQQAFYSIEELADYYGDEIKFPLSLGLSDYEAEELLMKYEDGDNLRRYDEVDGGDKKQYDFYALSNLTEESDKSSSQEEEAW